jgi:hypothetical protein
MLHPKDVSVRSKWFGFCTSISRRRLDSVKEIGLRLTLRRVKDGFPSIQVAQDMRQMEKANRNNILQWSLTFRDLIAVDINILVKLQLRKWNPAHAGRSGGLWDLNFKRLLWGSYPWLFISLSAFISFWMLLMLIPKELPNKICPHPFFIFRQSNPRFFTRLNWF